MDHIIRKVAIAAVIGAVLLPLRAAWAAENSLTGLMHRALAQNPDIAAARAQVSAAVGRLKQAGLWPNPRLGLSNEAGADGSYTRSIGISQDFPIADRIGRAQSVGRVDVARALAEVNEAERQLLGQITATYYQIIALNQRLAITDRLIDLQKPLVDASTTRNKAGEVSELDVNTATLELERLTQQGTVLRAERAAKLRTLAGLVGLDANVPLNITAVSVPFEGLPPVPVLIRRALDRRPDLRLLELTANRAVAEQALARASAWEDWTVSVGARRDKLVVEGAPPQTPDNSLALSLSVPLPLFNRNQGTIAAAVADETTARKRARALELRIKNDVTGEYDQANALLAVARQFKSHDLPLAERTTAVARDSYTKGQLSMSELVQIAREQTGISTGYADTLAQYLAVLASLRTSTVTDLPMMTHMEKTANAQ